MREELVIGGIYEHFKSIPEDRKLYKVLGQARTRQNFDDSSKYRTIYKGRNCENTDEEFDVLEQIADAEESKKGDLWIKMSGNFKYVIYKQLYVSEEFPEGTIWIRETGDFLGRKTKEDGTKVRRFRLVEGALC